MSNWYAIQATDLSGAKVSGYVNAATANGWDESGAIADVTARVRSAVSAGNALDQDATKIPNSLKSMAIRMILVQLKDFLDMELTATEKMAAEDDSSFLRRIIDEKLKFETPDTASGSAEMQSPAPIQVVTRQRPFATYRNMRGLT